MRKLTCTEGGSNKFWQIEVEGTTVTTRWGRIGTTGQSKEKAFSSRQAALAEHDKLIREKVNKGYRDAGKAPAKAEAVNAAVEKAQRTPPPSKRASSAPAVSDLVHMREIVLAKRAKTARLSMGRGHVWLYVDGSSGIGHPLHDARKELVRFDQYLRELTKAGWSVKSDTGLRSRKKPVPRKPAAFTEAEWRWCRHADEATKQWREGDYDNLKDAILDARVLLGTSHAKEKRHMVRAHRVTKMLAAATAELEKLVKTDPEMASYAKGLI